ncbi:hypothetical protein NKH77_49635 [Streptomyces sp. M19]
MLGNQLSPALTRWLTVRWGAAAGSSSPAPRSPVSWPSTRTPGGVAGAAAVRAGRRDRVVVAPMTTEMMAALPPEYTGAGAAVAAAARPVGSTLGVAVLGSVLATSYRRSVRPALAGLPSGDRARALDSAEATGPWPARSTGPSCAPPRTGPICTPWASPPCGRRCCP